MTIAVTDNNDAQELVGGLYEQEVQEMLRVITDRLPYFHRVALRHLGCAADAEDAVQDALLSAYKHVGQFRGQAQMSTWLTSIVINSALMTIRRRPRQLHISLSVHDAGEANHPFAERVPDYRPDPEAQFRRSELEHTLIQLSKRLSPALRGAFQLRDLDGLSIRETADALGITESSVKARTLRARARLKQLAKTGSEITRRTKRRSSDRKAGEWHRQKQPSVANAC